MSLSQAAVANCLGVSQQAVGEWETGKSYPKTEHLKALITLAVQRQAFAAGHEVEEIRRLWNAISCKELLDECWLSALLAQPRRPFLYVVPSPVEEKRSRVPAPTRPAPRVDWGDALALPVFYGREEELDRLTQWVLQDRCRVVSVLGMGGIGKSALVVNLMYQLASDFEVVIFRSLRDAPSCEVLLDECLQVLSPQQLRAVPATLEQRFSLLLSHLQGTRTLLVLDNLEALLKEADVGGHLRADLEGYGQLLQLVAQRGHQSCLLSTSREKPAELKLLENRFYPMRSLRLRGLDVAASQQLLEEKELVGTRSEQERLVEIYAGNPMALKIVAETIRDLFGGEIGPFLASGAVVFGSITQLLDEQFARLSAVEQCVLCWLAIVREPVTLPELLALLTTLDPRAHMLEAVESLHRRSLIERGKRAGSFTLQSVVLEYVTAVLIAEVSSEIQQRCLNRLIRHGLSQAQAKEYVRQTQERLLLFPVLVELQKVYQRRNEVEEQLLFLLDALREQDDSAQGYGPANLIALLRVLRGHLCGLDLSRLFIRRASLQGIEMHNASLVGATVHETTFTQDFGSIWSVAVSSDGKWWAAGSKQGEVRVWEKEGQILSRNWHAHTDIVPTLAFSPKGHTLATGSWDGTVKVWDVDSGALLWTGEHPSIISLAFSPDGSLLATGGRDNIVKFWDSQSGLNVQGLVHPSYVAAVAFSPDGSLLASGGFDGAVRLWSIQKTQPARCVQVLSGHTNWVMGLAFDPSGRTLASGSWDWTIKLWDIASGSLPQTISEHKNRVHCLDWSADGRWLASCDVNNIVCLWEREQGISQAFLYGHTSAVFSIAFTPDSSRLLSGSEDGTLRVWDVQRKQCMHVIQSYAVSLSELDWSPDGTQLVSGGTDGLVTLWDLSEEIPLRLLHGHTQNVEGVGWSPDGRFLASSGWDTILLVWDTTTGDCIEKLKDALVSFTGLAWSPDGQRLAYGTLMHGIQVWDRTEHGLCWAARKHSAVIRHVAWSADGKRLIAGGDDGAIYQWDATDGTLLQQFPGHHGIVMRVAWSPNSKLLASCGGNSTNGEIFVWDMQRGERIRAFTGYPSIVYALVWSPSGDQLISGGGDGVLRWWDVKTGECVGIRTTHHGTIHSLKVSPDKQRLASCGDDGTIMIWDLHTGEHLQTLRRNRPYERLNITGIKGLNEAQKATLYALGAIEDVQSPKS
jgi:WD40 repeat protein/transcriptional regulator with XRE-family HTH domain